MVNPQKLAQELIIAGIHFIGIHSDSGRVWDEIGDVQERRDVADIIAVHDPSEVAMPTIEERLTGLETVALEILLGGQ
jgi:hypothetical protein